jgi:hypothetical protein
MVFIPEGQHDRSQARSAWLAMQREPRPGGTVEVVVSREWREVKERLGRSPGRVRLRPNRGFPHRAQL